MFKEMPAVKIADQTSGRLGFANPAPKPNSNSNQDEFDVQKEAAWVLANVMHGYQSDPSLHAANRVRTLVQMGCLGASPSPER